MRRYLLTLETGEQRWALGQTVAQAIGKLPRAERALVLLAETDA